MKKIALALFASLLATSALAQGGQGPAVVVYPTTPGDCIEVGAQGGGYLADAGAACGGGGGGGSPGGSTNAIQKNAGGGAFGGVGPANNAVVVTNGTGVPSESTTLPSALTIPSPTFSGTVAGAGTVPNSVLSNSSLTIAGHSVSLGGTQALACADLSNGGTACPANTGTSGTNLCLLNTNCTWSGVQSFTDGDLVLSGSSSGAGTLHAPAAASTYAWTLPANTGTLAELNFAQAWTALQTFSSGISASAITDSGITGSTQCLHVNSSGLMSGTGSDCGAGGGSLTVTDGTHSVSSTTTLTFGNGITVGGSGGSATATPTTSDNTQSANYTILASDMGGVINLTGSHTLTIPAISGTVLAANMSVCFANQGSGTWTISTTPTINGMTGTSLPPGSGGCLVSNGTSLDFQQGMQPPSTTVLGGVLSASASTNQFQTGIGTTGAPTFAQPAFSNLSGTATSGQLPADAALTDANQTFTKSQRSSVGTISISTSTFTPNFDNNQNFTMTLVHASCPCTMANPSTTPVAGQSGVLEIIQSSTGSDTIGTWGSDYTYAGGTSTIALSTGANARDYLSYYVADSTHIVLSGIVANATH